MDSEARLMRALGPSAAPKRDPRFTLAVIEAAERARFRNQTALSMLRGAGYAGATAALAAPFLNWAGSNGQGLQTGIIATAGLFALIWGSRLVARRAATVLGR